MSTELYTPQLERILSSRHFTGCGFGGVYPADKLPRRVSPTKRFYVANTDPAHKAGEHWVAFFFTPNNTCVYFDSFGLPPLLTPFHRFIEENSERWIYNSKRLQHPSSTLCGHYCIFFLHFMCMGKTLDSVVGALSDDLKWNDWAVTDFVNHFYQVDGLPSPTSPPFQTCGTAKRCKYFTAY